MSRITKSEYMTSHFLALAVEKDGSGIMFPPLWYYATVLYFGDSVHNCRLDRATCYLTVSHHRTSYPIKNYEGKDKEMARK
ncbi:hypothetical protein AKJ16_DCAP14885 [Drosera capensis]